MNRNALLVFTRPARPGRVKTRLTGEVTPEQAAELHAAFRDDLVERLARGAAGGDFDLELSWALDDGEDVPACPVADWDVPGGRQVGEDLGERLCNALTGAARRYPRVAAVGSDHPELAADTVADAFRRLKSGADLVLGPVPDGGYFLIGLRRDALHRELFEGIAWSTETVLEATLDRARRLGLTAELLPEGHDIDRPDDLRELAGRLAHDDGGCPRTRALLASWGRLDASNR